MLFDILFTLNHIPFVYKILIFITFSIAVIIALTAHEFSHAFVAYKLGDSTPKAAGRLTLNPMAHFDLKGLLCFLLLGFGWAKPVPINSFNFKKIKRDTFLVSIAGVVTNLILAFVFYPLAVLLLNITWKSEILYALYSLCYYLFSINLVFMVFNLLPIHPLDGFNAIASQLSYTNRFVTFMQKYGVIILFVVIVIFSYTDIFNVLVDYIGYPIREFWNLVL